MDNETERILEEYGYNQSYYDSLTLQMALSLVWGQGQMPATPEIHYAAADSVKEGAPNYGWAQKLKLACRMINPLMFERGHG